MPQPTIKSDWTREELERSFIGKMTAVPIPINISISGKQKILDMSELEQLLRNAEIIAQEICSCRKKYNNCIEPMDGCLCIDGEAEIAIEKYGAKKITIEEAFEAMKRTYDAGLVHMAYVLKGTDKVEKICSCCSCCCHSLSAAIRFGYSDHVFKSDFIAIQDQDVCLDCGVCVDRCQFGARIIVDGKMNFRVDHCFGCGLCIESCSENAIEMLKR